MDVDEGLENRIKECAHRAAGLDEFPDWSKQKDTCIRESNGSSSTPSWVWTRGKLNVSATPEDPSI